MNPFKHNAKKSTPERVVVDFSPLTAEQFEGFNQSVQEGLTLANHSYTEIPGLDDEHTGSSK